MAEKGMVLHALFAMIDAENNNTRIMAARTTSNLVLCKQVQYLHSHVLLLLSALLHVIRLSLHTIIYSL